MLSVRDGILSVGCKCRFMGSGDHAIGDRVVDVGVAECSKKGVRSCLHIDRILEISSMGVL